MIETRSKRLAPDVAKVAHPAKPCRGFGRSALGLLCLIALLAMAFPGAVTTTSHATGGIQGDSDCPGGPGHNHAAGEPCPGSDASPWGRLTGGAKFPEDEGLGASFLAVAQGQNVMITAQLEPVGDIAIEGVEITFVEDRLQREEVRQTDAEGRCQVTWSWELDLENDPLQEIVTIVISTNDTFSPNTTIVTINVANMGVPTLNVSSHYVCGGDSVVFTVEKLEYINATYAKIEQIGQGGWNRTANFQDNKAILDTSDPENTVDLSPREDNAPYVFVARLYDENDNYQGMTNEVKVWPGYEYESGDGIVLNSSLLEGQTMTFYTTPGSVIAFDAAITDWDQRGFGDQEPEKVPSLGPHLLVFEISGDASFKDNAIVKEVRIRLAYNGVATKVEPKTHVYISGDWDIETDIVVKVTVRDQGASPDDLCTGSVIDSSLSRSFTVKYADVCPDGLEIHPDTGNLADYAAFGQEVEMTADGGHQTFLRYTPFDGNNPTQFNGMVSIETWTDPIAGFAVSDLNPDFIMQHLIEPGEQDRAAKIIVGTPWTGSFIGESDGSFADLWGGVPGGLQHFTENALTQDHGITYTRVQTFSACGNDIAQHLETARLHAVQEEQALVLEKFMTRSLVAP